MIGLIEVSSWAPVAPVIGPTLTMNGSIVVSRPDDGRVTRPAHVPSPVELNAT